MHDCLKNWYFDTAGESKEDFDIFNDMVQAFVNFMNCPATSMGVRHTQRIAICGEVAGRGKVVISGVSLIDKVDSGYRVTTTSGITYRLAATDMDEVFRKDFVLSQKVINITQFAASF